MKTALFQADDETVMLIGVAAIGLLWIVGGFVLDAAAGVVSGDNAITRSQTNADGEKVDAYEKKGIPGTLGGVANTASGGVLASIGQAIGRWTFDVFGPRVDINAPAPKLDKPTIP